MSLNGQGTVEDTDMTDDGEKVVTMMDVLQEQQEFEEDANAVLGASDDKNCTYSKGYIKRQAIYACLTCCPDAKTDPLKRAGVCLACCLSCHENHDLVELYTKRNFRCDCGNPKFNSHPCQFTPNKTDLNEENVYDQNFSGFYCVCHRPYPDPEAKEEDEMIQCIICEDWLHATHLEATVPPHDQYAEMVCKSCMEKNAFLYDYSVFTVTGEGGDVDIITVNGMNLGDKICNGDLEKNPTDKETKHDDVDMVVENGDKPEERDQSPESKNKDETKTDEEEKNTATQKELVAETHDKEPECIDKTSENAESKTTENPSDVPMETEAEHAESVSRPVNDSSEKNCEIDSKDEKIITQSVKDEMPTTADAEKLESITELEKPESINEAVTDIEKPESITESEKTETRSEDLDSKKCMEMTESEKEKTLLQDESTDIVQSKVSEDVMESEDTRNNETDNSGMETVTNTNNKDEKQTKSSPIPAKGSTDTDNISEEKSQEGLEKKLVEVSETHKSGDEKSMDSSSQSIDKSNKISTNEPIPPEDKNSTPESSSLQEKPSNVECEDSILNNVSSLKDNTELPKLEDTNKVLDQETSKDTESSDTTKDIIVSENKADVEMSGENKIEKKTNDGEVSNYSAKTVKDSEAKPTDILDTTIPSENKRKLSTDTPDDTSAKKAKLNDCENITELETKQCVRPRGVKKIHKGATFWPQCFRQKLCTCNECLTMYKDLAVLFLLDPEDTVTAYETLGKEKTDGGPSTQYEKGLQALSTLDRIQQINALTEYNKMRDKLLDFLKSFKDRKEIVKEEDIKAFFAGMKPKREPDGVYFCR